MYIYQFIVAKLRFTLELELVYMYILLVKEGQMVNSCYRQQIYTLIILCEVQSVLSQFMQLVVMNRHNVVVLLFPFLSTEINNGI